MIAVHPIYAINTDSFENKNAQQRANLASTDDQKSLSFAEHLQSHIQSTVVNVNRYAESQVAGVSVSYWGLTNTQRHPHKSELTRTREDLKV